MVRSFSVRIHGRISRGETALPTGILKKGEENSPRKEIFMPKTNMPPRLDPVGIHSDPLGIAEKPALFHNLTDMALAGDMPASRLFSNMSVSLERDVRGEMIRERRETRGDQQGE